MDGIINIIKPPGMTSHDIVARMRRLTRQRKIGHCGTLDPGAAGVLPVFLGKATRLIEYGMEWDKTYRVELTLGGKSESGDEHTPIQWEQNPVYPEEEILRNILNEFVGTQSQIPPMHSALKVEGQKLYDLARAGKTIEREPREIEVHSIELLKYSAPKVYFDVKCSKGTYIRTLCEDIAKKLGTTGIMTFLVRLQVGEFDLYSGSLPCNTIDEWLPYLIDMEKAVEHYSAINLTEEESRRFCSGQKIELNHSLNSKVRVKFEKRLLGIGSLKVGILSADKVLQDLRQVEI